MVLVDSRLGRVAHGTDRALALIQAVPETWPLHPNDELNADQSIEFSRYGLVA